MIVAVFNNDDYARALGLTQWDYGQELRIQGLNLPTAVEIHFSLRETGGEAVTRVGITKDGITTVPIPDSMLEGEGAAYDYQIYAWVYLSDTKSGETIKRITMPVKARSKPEPFDKPEDGEIFREAIEAVNEAADRAEKAGSEAVKVGEEAKEAAAKAGEHLEAVQGLAEQVEINADSVAQDKQAVAGMVTQTQQAASEAALSEQAAKQSQAAAEQAQAGAEVAEDAARQYAAETEEDRQEVAEDKQAVTQMRKDVAANRQAVEDAIAGFDGAVQGAMGEIASAGKTQVAAVNTAGQTAVYAVNTAKGEAVKAVDAEGTEQAGIVAAEGAKQLGEIKRVMDTIPEDYTDLSELAESNYRNKAPGIVETASGAMIEIKDGSDLPLQGLTVYGRSTQGESPSVENPQEIETAGDSGAIDLALTGAQMFDVADTEMNSILNADGSTSANGSINTSGFIRVAPNTTYSVSRTRQNRGKFYDSAKKPLTTDKFDFELANNGDKFTTSANVEYVRFSIYGTEDLNALMMNSGESLKPWEPYTEGTAIALSTPNGLPGISVTSGGNYTDQNGQQWVCDAIEHRGGVDEYVQRLKTVNAKDIAWIKDSYNGIMRYTSLQPDIKRNGAIISNRFVRGNYSDVPGKCSTDEAKLRCCFDTSYDTLDKVRQFFAENETVFMYELVEPIRTPLTQNQLNAIKQLHTFRPTTIITNDAGVDMQVDYVADTKAYIENMEKRWNTKLVNIQAALISQKISGGGIKVTDSARMPIKTLRVFGKSTQRKTEGNNLYSGEQEVLKNSGVDTGFTFASAEFIEFIKGLPNGEYSASYDVKRLNTPDSILGANAGKIGLQDIDGKYLTGPSTTFTMTDEIRSKVTKIGLYGYYKPGFSNVLSITENFMINSGSKALPYEPYTGGQASPSLNYPQDIEIAGESGDITIKVGASEDDANPQTVILHTLNGLPGIPVSKDGNYIDANGQQWVCDSIEYDNAIGQAEYVQRVGLFRTADGFDNAKIEITDGEGGVKRIIITLSDADPEFKRKPVLCTHGRFYSSGAKEGTTFTYSGGIWYTTAFTTLTVDEARTFLVENQMEWLYILAEPIRTPLTAEQVTAIKQLHTFCPTTIITNDAGVDLEVSYVADTKAYIDSKIDALSKTILDAVIGGK